MARIDRVLRRLLFGPRVQIKPFANLVHLGSRYGGWTFVDDSRLHGSIIISGGLGEDATFDLEFAARYAASICIVDPTPRAIAHFETIMRRMGSPAKVRYGPTGTQIPEAYDQTQVLRSQLQLVPRALTNREGTVRLYAPPDPQHVSYSIVNFQNSYSQEGAWIEVPSIDVASLFQSMTPPGVELLKIDIEGAETLVIPRLLESGVALPNQVLIEFDELSVPSRRSRRSFYHLHSLMLDAGYVPVYWDKRTCLSYLLLDDSTGKKQRA